MKKNEKTCSQEAKKHNFQPAPMSQCTQQSDRAASSICGLAPLVGFYLVQEPWCWSIRPVLELYLITMASFKHT